jgi:hypothetical protein
MIEVPRSLLADLPAMEQSSQVGVYVLVEKTPAMTTVRPDRWAAWKTHHRSRAPTTAGCPSA